MTPKELFDKLLDKQQITVQVTGDQAESLRVQLVKRFSTYKKDLDAAGFLGDDQKMLALTTVRFTTKTTYKIARRKAYYNYQLVEDDEASDV